MSNENTLKDWIYEHAAEDLSKETDKNESSIRTAFQNWWDLSRIHPLTKAIQISNVELFLDALITEYLTKTNYKKPVGFSYQDEESRPWINQRTDPIQWAYWDKYRNYLVHQKKWGENTVRSMDIDATNILDLMGDPESPANFDRRGLVVASVQSGKTANYIGLITKAVDAGYRIIIVLAGIHNVLRNQTQERIEDGFIGINTITKKETGVGTIHTRQPGTQKHPACVTTRVHDFNKVSEENYAGLFSDHIRGSLVFVVKKNTRVLDALYAWLQHQCSQDEPMLLIDDEADNASINIKYAKNDVSRINSQIRQILEHFHKKAYVGYTATPFANVLIDASSIDDEYGSDIFPRSFIYTLEQSDAYFGAEKVFSDYEDPHPKYLRIIPEVDEGTDDLGNPIPKTRGLKKDEIPTELPEALKGATRTFLIACAIRECAGEGQEHASMMVNLSPYKLQQQYSTALLRHYVDDISNAVDAYANMPSAIALQASPMLQELYHTWDVEFNNTRTSKTHRFNWDDIQHALRTVMNVRIAVINSDSKDVLDYSAGPQRVIAVGGYRLSRGLTLEGLMVSYYDRNARAYDTLMQMARWFGYRMGYEDLCRIWMTERSAKWYSYVADATERLVDEMRELRTAHSTPKQYELHVRTDIDTLTITAPNKQGAAAVSAKARLDGSFVETTAFDRDAQIQQHNEDAARRFLADLAAEDWLQTSSPSGDKGYFAHNVPVSRIREFLRNYRNSEASPKSEITHILEHIGYMTSKNHDLWDVYIPDVSGESGQWSFAENFSVNNERRTPGRDTSTSTIRFAKDRLSSRGIENRSLTPAQIKQIDEQFHEEFEDIKNVPDIRYRHVDGRIPLLIIHSVTVKFQNEGKYNERLEDPSCSSRQAWPDAEHEEHYIGWSISFPQYGIEETVSYIFNDSVRNNQFQDEFDMEEMDDDDQDE